MKNSKPYLNDTYALATIPCYKMPHVSHGNEVEKRKLILNKKPAGLY